MSALSFDGDVIVVTGAGGGMGRCHALELASRGAPGAEEDVGVRIELAAVRERLKKLEAIASGVEL